MVQNFFYRLGLDQKEIDVYMELLRYGPNRSSSLGQRLNLPRTTVQNILTRLESENLVTKAIEKNTYIFSPVHPEELADVMELRKRQKITEYNELLDQLHEITPDLKNLMHSEHRMPQVQFYQGREGCRKVLFDTLNSKTELLDFANIDAMFKHVKDINDEYVAEREKSKITKRSLLLDTPFARKVYESGKYSPKSHKGYKWIPSDPYPFALEMNIYDGKISYMTYVENDFVGVIIQNDHIYEMHKSMWNLLWDLLPEPKE